MVGVTGARRRGRSGGVRRAASVRVWPHGDTASTVHARKRSFSAAVVIAAALSVLLASFSSGRVDAYGIVAWTAAVHGAAFDPNAFPGITELGGSHVLALDAGGNAYVTGTARNGFNGGLLTIKYGSSGPV